MKNFKLLPILLAICLSTTISYSNSSNENPSLAAFKNNTANNFNPFETLAELGSAIQTGFGNGTSFFGATTDSVWGGTANANDNPDGVYSNTFVFPNKKSRYLFTKNFSLNIPCNATITDITFNITRQNGSDADASDFLISIFNPHTLQIGALNNADPSNFITGGTWETISYSDPNWGEAITPEMLNDPKFGLIMQFQHAGVSGVAEPRIDAVEVSVCYDVTGPAIVDPINITTVKENACFDQGSLTIEANGGSGSYQYSIDDGMNWQPSNVFSNLSSGDYIVKVSNSDGSCETASFFCTISPDDRILQPGDALVACSTQNTGSSTTLAIEKVQSFNNFYNAGTTGSDISSAIPFHPFEWTTTDLGGEVFSVVMDDDRNIYTGASQLYRMAPSNTVTPVASCINGVTGAVTQITTLPGNHGINGVEINTNCNHLYLANNEDGIIYRVDAATGAQLSSFDPLTPDDGAAGLVPLGERVVAVSYNYTDGRLYYSMWNSDYNQTGIRNTIRSVAIDPATCDFVPGSDIEEFELLWTQEWGDVTNTDVFSMPVGDIEFSADGMSMLLAEVGFNSATTSNKWVAHHSRLLEYNGTTTAWALNMTVPAGNVEMQFEIGETNQGLNARGGVDFGNAGFDNGCSIDDETFIVATADALRGADCDSYGCIYGLQYLSRTTTNAPNSSVLLDIGRDLSDQQKSIFGDIDMVAGCPAEEACCPEITTDAGDLTYCPGESFGAFSVLSGTSSVSLVYHTTVPTSPAGVYAGTSIDVQPVVGGTATLNLTNLPTASGTYYLYAIADPAPTDVTCRPYDSIEVLIVTDPTLTISGPATACADDAALAYTATPVPGVGQTGVFTTTAAAGLTDNGNGTASLDPTMATAGTYDIIYTFTDENNCEYSLSYEVVIDPCLEYDLELSKVVTSSGPYGQGSTVTYDITVNNTGGIAATNIVVVDAAPTGLTYVSSSAATNANITENTPGNYTILSIPANGGTETIMLTYQISATFMGTSLTNVAQITSDDGDDIDSDPSEDENTDDLADGLPDDDEDEATVMVGQSYDLSLAKTVTSTGPYAQGSTVTYQIVVSNDGTITSGAVTVTDTPPTGLTYVSSDAGTNANVAEPSNGVFNITDIASMTTETINVTYTIDNSFTGTSLTNVGQITSDTGDDVDSDPNDDENTDDLDDGLPDDDEDEATVMVGQSYDLSFTKTVTSSGPYTQGSTVIYQLVVSNDGTVPSGAVTVTDTPPAGLTYVSSDAGTNANVAEPSNGVFDITDIASMATETITVTYTIDNSFMGTSLTNVGQITSDTGDDLDSDPDDDENTDDLGDGLPDDDEDDAEITVGQSYDLALSKTLTGTGPYMPGSNVVFQIVVNNQGSVTSGAVTVTDTPPAGLTYVSSDAGTNANVAEPTPGVFDITDIASMGSETINVTYQIAATFMGTSLDNIAEITSDSGVDVDSDPDSDSNTDDLGDGNPDDDEDNAVVMVGQNYDLDLTKVTTSTGPYSPGSTVNYQIVVNNNGTINSGAVTINDTPQTGLTYVSSDAATNANVTETTPGVWNITDIATSTSETINVTYQISNTFMGGTLGNVAQITSDSGDDVDSDPDADENTDDLGDGLPDDDEDEVVIMVGQVYDLAVAKTVTSTGPFMPGSTITFQIVVTNEGTVDSGVSQVTDSAPAGLTYVSSDAAANGNVTEATPGVFTISNVPVTSNETINITYTIDASFTGTSLTNWALITGDDGMDHDSDPGSDENIDDLGDGLSDDDEDDATFMVMQGYDIAVSKNIATMGPYGPGDNLTYNIVVTNEGITVAGNIEVTDTPSNGLVYVSSNASTNANITETSPGVWIVNALSSMNSETIQVTYQISPTYANATIGNAVQITGDDGNDIDSDPNDGPDVDDLDDGIPDDDEDEVIIDVELPYDLSLNKTVTSSGPYAPGDNITYSIVVSNDGLVPANNIEFTDSPTSTLIFISDDSGTNANVTSLGGGIYQVASLPVGATETLNLSFQIDPSFNGGNVGNAGEITADDGDDQDSDPDDGPDVDDHGDGIPDDDEDEIIIDVVINGEIGDYIWEDINGDGTQDAGEPGVSNVKVTLYNGNGFIVDTYYTDNSGYYLFDELPPGNYYIEVDFPTGLTATFPNLGGDDNLDSDLDNGNGAGTTSLIALGSGESDLSIDIGLIECIPIGETVWFDYNQNDQFEFFENGINGLRVELFRQEAGGWTLWDFTYTDHKPGTESDDGYYKFCVMPGTYYIRFVNPPSQLVPVVPNQGTNESLDSDITGSFGAGTTDQFTVTSGDERCDIGAGFYAMGTIGDLVWLDNNANGMRESNEPGLEGIIVRAIDINGNEIGSAQTDADGNYVIDYLTKNTLFLEFDTPQGMQVVPANMGTDEAMDSDVDDSNGPNTTEFYNINPGIHVPNVDAGMRYRVLAIEWDDIKAENVETHNLVQWTVKTDVEISHYEVERSVDGTNNFEVIAKVLADLSTNTEKSYSIEDFNVLDNKEFYYRVKQVDLNGGVSTSKIVSVLLDETSGSNSIKIYPNPVVNELLVNININNSVQNLSIDIYDKLGRLVKDNIVTDKNINVSTKDYKIDISSLPEGIYNVRVNMDETFLFKKMIVIKN